MERRYDPRVRLEPLPPRLELCKDLESAQRSARMRELRTLLPQAYLPPPIVPLRAHILETEKGQRLFLELRNFSGLVLSGLGVEAVTLDAEHKEQDVMFAALSDLHVAADPRRVVPVGGFALDPRKPATGAIITVLYAHFGDGSVWDGELDTLEDPRLPELHRMQCEERFLAAYRGVLSAVEGLPAWGASN